MSPGASPSFSPVLPSLLPVLVISPAAFTGTCTCLFRLWAARRLRRLDFVYAGRCGETGGELCGRAVCAGCGAGTAISCFLSAHVQVLSVGGDVLLAVSRPLFVVCEGAEKYF